MIIFLKKVRQYCAEQKYDFVWFCKDIERVYTGKKVNAVDTTGAGDTYIGYFVRCIVEEMPLLETAQMATKASAIAVTRFGAVDSIPNYEEVFE